ncbi:MAG: hypothetical protein CMH55_10010, partial [Myxococcales bacterium]|nr:hypothetical protein [Myxococcales bacterium]
EPEPEPADSEEADEVRTLLTPKPLSPPSAAVAKVSSPADEEVSETGATVSEHDLSEVQAAGENESADQDVDRWMDDDWDEAPKSGGALQALLVIGLIAGGGYGLLTFLTADTEATAEFDLEAQVKELGLLIEDKSCTNAKRLYDKLMAMELNAPAQRLVRKREKGVEKCLKAMEAREQRNAAPDPETTAAIAKTLVFTNLQKDHFGKPQEIKGKVWLTLEDARVVKGEEGELIVGVQVTIKPRQTGLFDERSFSLFDNNEALDQARWFRPIAKEAETVFMPRLGAGQMERGKAVTGWVTFGGLDAEVKHLALQYRPVWAGADPFVGGISPDMITSAPPAEAPAVTDAGPADAAASDGPATAANPADNEPPPLAAPSPPKADPAPKPTRAAPVVRSKPRPRIRREEPADEPELERAAPRIVDSSKALAGAERARARGDHRRVVAETRRLLKKDPGNAEAYYLMGWAQLQMNDFGNARRNLSKATSLGAPAEAYYNLGIAYQMLGDNEKAVRNFQRFVSRAPGHEKAGFAKSLIEGLKE